MWRSFPEEFRVTLSLTNTLDPASVSDLSPSIAGTSYPMLGIGKAVQRVVVFAYLPAGSTLLAATVDGVLVDFTGQSDGGHPVQVMWTLIAPGETSTVSVDLMRESSGERDLQVEVTPLLTPAAHTTGSLDCATVTLP